MGDLGIFGVFWGGVMYTVTTFKYTDKKTMEQVSHTTSDPDCAGPPAVFKYTEKYTEAFIQKQGYC